MDVRIGGARVDFDQARAWCESYFEEDVDAKPWAYPAYDTYQPGNDPSRLEDADLLAPVLLNVTNKYLQAYYGLKSIAADLEAGLKEIALDDDLVVSADKAAKVGSLFAVLDRDKKIKQVRGTTLAKVLHRKRPRYIPLYDENIRYCYQDTVDAPLPRAAGQTWVEFMTLFTTLVHRDLAEQADVWQRLADLARPEAPVTLLRTLDIVGWHAGQQRIPGTTIL